MKTTDKYIDTLALYNLKVDDAQTTQLVNKLLAEKAPEHRTEEVKRLLLSCIDLTSLDTADTDRRIMQWIEKVNALDNEHPDLPHVAAICVYPKFADIARQTLQVEGVDIACVAGGFPSSQTFIEVKVAETALAVADGADEIDIVLSVGSFLAGDYETLCDEIAEIKAACGTAKLKVILETGALGSLEQVKRAAILSMYAGADFIKTSTGKMQPAATPEAAYVMCQAIREYHQKTGRRIGFKPAGGINTVDEAVNYYTIVREVLGEEWLNKDLFRIGTSRLTNRLLSELLQEEANIF